jgi:hypothetical protein
LLFLHTASNNLFHISYCFVPPKKNRVVVTEPFDPDHPVFHHLHYYLHPTRNHLLQRGAVCETSAVTAVLGLVHLWSWANPARRRGERDLLAIFITTYVVFAILAGLPKAKPSQEEERERF